MAETVRRGGRRGMGRGLAAIIADTAAQQEGDASEPTLRRLPLDAIRPSPAQPRRTFEPDALDALTASVQERGVLQPVLVRPRADGRYELVAGERRWRAAGKAGLDVIPALVQERDDASAVEVALVENMARADLNPVEEARALSVLVEDLGVTREAVARRVGRSRSAVSNLLRILELPDEVLDLVGAGMLSEGHARAVLLAEDHGARRALARRAATEGWSVRALEERARGARHAEPRPRRRGADRHPDEAAALTSMGEALSRALGVEARATLRGGVVHAELRLGPTAEARDVVARIVDPSSRG